MPTFHDFAGTVPYTLTGTVAVESLRTLGDGVAVAMAAGVSGDVIPYKISGLVKGLAKATGTAFVVMESVYFNGTAFAVATATTLAHGFAYSSAIAGATTCDVILTPCPSLAVS